MTVRPHDVADVFLSPVVLNLDRRLAEFDGLSEEEVAFRVILETNHEPASVEERPEIVLEALTRLVATHGWEVSWVPRGLLVSHDDHELVLGVPESLRGYLNAQ